MSIFEEKAKPVADRIDTVIAEAEKMLVQMHSEGINGWPNTVRDLLAALASQRQEQERAECGSKMLLAAIMVTADDAEPSDFELSFPEVRAVYDLQLMRKGAEADLARVRADYDLLQKGMSECASAVVDLRAAKDAADALMQQVAKEMREWDGVFGPRTEKQLLKWADLLAPPTKD